MNLLVAIQGGREVFALGTRGIWGDPTGADAAGKRQFFGPLKGAGAWAEVTRLLPSV